MSVRPTEPRVALVHDFLLDVRGAERVFMALCEEFPDADLFTAVYDEEGTEGRFAHRRVHTSFLQRANPTARTFRAMLPLYPYAIEALDLRGYDVVLSSLFTHHLGDADVVRYIRWMEASAARGWFVNDLHRHWVAYHGFRALSAAAGWHRFVRHDGPLSVARSFRRTEWHGLLRQAGLAGVAEVRWHLPFRFCVGRVR